MTNEELAIQINKDSPELIPILWERISKFLYSKAKRYYRITSYNVCYTKLLRHIKYITPMNIQDPNITLNWDNLEALCMDCHTREHLGSSSCIDGVSFDQDGNLIYKP